MRKGSIFLLTVLGFLASSCDEDFGERSVNPGTFLPGDGVFIVNEGNFNQGNGSISFFSYADGSVSHDIFRDANDRPLGDLPVSMTIAGDRFFVSVNHSGRIETGDAGNLVSDASITLTPSPRQVHVLGQELAAVSDLQSPDLVLFNPMDGNLTGKVSLGRSSEAMVVSGSELFAGNWSSFYVPSDNRYVMVVDLVAMAVSDSVMTGLEPQSMVPDHLGRIWVLCSGGWDNSELPVLLCFDPATRAILRWFEFPSKDRSPVHLSFNPTLDTLYYIDTHIYRMAVDAPALPQQPFLEAGTRQFYALGIHPSKGDIFVSDALDFQQDGKVWRYDRQGREKNVFRAGIIPGGFCFN